MERGGYTFPFNSFGCSHIHYKLLRLIHTLHSDVTTDGSGLWNLSIKTWLEVC